ncbi:hypothetical protein SporoP37_00325 [Sporosarcina sp. P37]|nr:hypothetical protein SporoP37_00325 [Sporosarcina sp. P37]PID19537.1 hypothetical protein CSV62_03275 [Sporosarcina sp. P35]
MTLKVRSGNSKQPRSIKAEEARFRSKEIECRICRKNEVVQAHSYCSTSRLCAKCANREFDGWKKERE